MKHEFKSKNKRFATIITIIILHEKYYKNQGYNRHKNNINNSKYIHEIHFHFQPLVL